MLKKITGLFLIGAIILGFASCTKDGVYHPKEKISKVYTQAPGQAENLAEEWIWSGDNLAQINFHRTIGKDYIVSFEYDGKRITKMTSTEGDVTTFVYDGSKLVSAETKNGNQVTSTMKFEYDGHLISEINGETTTGLKSLAVQNTLLRLLLNDEVAQLLEEQVNVSQLKGRVTYELDFTFANQNISEIEFTLNGRDEKVISYTYNKDYKNPFHHLIMSDEDYASMLTYEFDFNLSKNLPATETIVNEAGKDVCKVEYAYEGKKYPTKETRSVTNYLIDGFSTTSTTIYRYEYK